MRIARRSLAPVSAALALFCLPVASPAQTAVGVSGDVVQGCDISLSAPAITMNYDFTANATVDATATDPGSVTCGTGTPLDISFGSDTAYDSPYTLAMTGPGTIVVQLKAVYNFTTGTTFTVTADAPAGQNPVIGSYTANTTVNVDFF